MSRVLTKTTIVTDKFGENNPVPDSIKDIINNSQGETAAEKLENTMVESVIKDKVEQAIQGNQFVTTDDVQSELIDVSLNYYDEEGELQKADKEHFPAEGKIVIVLPIPAGTKLSTHSFFVAHMFTSDAFGKGAGHIEYPVVTEFTDEDGNEYIKFEVTGLSPITLSYVETDPCADGHDYMDGKCDDCGHAYGDINEDGKVNSVDVAYLVAFFNGKIELDETVWKAYDKDGDGLDKEDIQAMLEYVLSPSSTT